jgi:hypothetical protein
LVGHVVWKRLKKEEEEREEKRREEKNSFRLNANYCARMRRMAKRERGHMKEEALNWISDR